MGSHARSRNRLLQSLTEAEAHRLWPLLELVPLVARRVIQYPMLPIRHVFFIERGLVSTLAKVGPGRPVEVGLAGREGMVGLPVLLGASVSLHTSIIQLAGTAYRIEAAAFCNAISQMGNFRSLLLRYAHSAWVESSQSAACNLRHTLNQRLARWLLAAREKCGDDRLPFSNESLSHILGVRRASVSQCISFFEHRGALRKTGRAIEICDPERLSAFSCGCQRLLGAVQRPLLLRAGGLFQSACAQSCDGIENRGWDEIDAPPGPESVSPWGARAG